MLLFRQALIRKKYNRNYQKGTGKLCLGLFIIKLKVIIRFIR